MRLLYLGDASGTSRHRVAALRRLGCRVDLIDPRACFGHSAFAEMWIWRCGSFGMESLVRRYVLSRLRRERYDICIVNHGELVGPSLLHELRGRVGAILNFNLDNPFVGRDNRRWRLFWHAARHYDLIATPRATSAEAGERAGLPMARFFQTADEVVHRPRVGGIALDRRLRTDVAFVGTWFPERGAFITQLLDAGLNVRIFGPNWHKSPEFARLKSVVAMSGPLDDRAYVAALRGSRILLGLLSAGNEDQHTTRSMEVPAVGSLLCARRTDEHRQLYREGEEAVFWDDAGECARHCRDLLANPERLAAIAAAGARRQAASDNWNEILLRKLIDATLARASRHTATGQAA